MPEPAAARYPWHDLTPPLAATALATRVQRILDGADAATRQRVAAARPDGGPGPYLDRMERIVRVAATWRDATGAIIDPYAGSEHGQTSPRFAAPGAILLAHGRCGDLADAIYGTMSYCCRRLADGEANSPDFWMRELATAYHCLQPIAPAERLAQWQALLRRVEPERTNKVVRPDGTQLDTLHNWVVYGAAGEAIRARAPELAPAAGSLWGDAFFDKYMPAQYGHFSDHGMYRDPGDPITYDITTRLQLAAALVYGYAGPLRAQGNALLAQGALTMLLFMSPDGHVPYGGRSAEYLFREAIVCALCELEARRYAGVDPRLAGAFKRQAQLSRAATDPWLDMHPWRSLKNAYPPAAGHGYDSYGVYSVYSLLVASFFGLAALWADDRIVPAPCPADIGGYHLELAPAFHKIFVSTQDTQVVIDSAADPLYDATGLGRFACRGYLPGLILGMPCAATPKYRLPAGIPTRAATFGPAWRQTPDAPWQCLADTRQGCKLRVLEEAPERCRWTLTWELPGLTLTEYYTLTADDTLLYRVATTAELSLQLRLPILDSDGEHTGDPKISPGEGYQVIYFRDPAGALLGPTLHARFPGNTRIVLDPERLANRHGIYRLLTADFPGPEASMELTLTGGITLTEWPAGPIRA